MEELKSYGKADRNPGFRRISIWQYALIRIVDYDKESVEENSAIWHDMDEISNLVQDAL